MKIPGRIFGILCIFYTSIFYFISNYQARKHSLQIRDFLHINLQSSEIKVMVCFNFWFAAPPALMGIYILKNKHLNSYTPQSLYLGTRLVKGEFQILVLNLIHQTNGEQTSHAKVLFVIIIHSITYFWILFRYALLRSQLF